MVKRRKKTRVLSKTQERARERNWNKGKILGIFTSLKKIQRAETTQLSEQIGISSIIHSLNKILQDWDKSNA